MHVYGSTRERLEARKSFGQDQYPRCEESRYNQKVFLTPGSARSFLLLMGLIY